MLFGKAGAMTILLGIAIGIVLLVVLRILFARILLFKLRRDLRTVADGDYGPLLKGFSDDAVLVFNDGDHRWAGNHVGKPAIETFLQNFIAAGLHGEIREIFVSGWPWSMTILARFDDASDLPDGSHLYDNQTVLLCRTRWGKVVRQEDYYYDTVRMETLEKELVARGI